MEGIKEKVLRRVRGEAPPEEPPEAPPEETPAAPPEAEVSTSDEPEASADSGPILRPLPTPTFGKRDPKEKAQRLARVLVSDIILYNPDRHQRALDEGRIKEEFDEISHGARGRRIRLTDSLKLSTPLNSSLAFDGVLDYMIGDGQKPALKALGLFGAKPSN